MLVPSTFEFRLATPASEAGLRKLLRDNPLSGDIRVALEREPNAFHAAAISGDRFQLILAFGDEGQRLVGAGARFELDAFVNGQVRRVGYLGELRTDGGLKRRRHLLIEAYRALRGYHESGNVRYYLTTIIADNRAARRLLEAGLGDMPTYEPLETLVTMTIPVKSAAARRRSSRRVVRLSEPRLDEAAALLERNGRHFQFHPLWTENILRCRHRCRGLSPGDLFVCEQGGRITACLALWDQRSFKQTVIRGYAGKLARLRPVFNAVAPLLRRPRLPASGRRLESAFLSHVCVEPGDGESLVALVRHACADAARRGLDYLMLAFAERNPMSEVVRRHFPCHRYVSMMYVVYWEDGKQAAGELDGRMPHPEMAIL